MHDKKELLIPLNPGDSLKTCHLQNVIMSSRAKGDNIDVTTIPRDLRVSEVTQSPETISLRILTLRS